LFAAFAALVGCGSEPSLKAPGNLYPVPTPEELKTVASKFQANPKSNNPISGEKMPLKFVDLEGKEVDLKSFHKKSNVVLVVVKGLPTSSGGRFCPGCLAQVNSLAANHGEFKKREAEIVMVFPGAKDTVQPFLTNARVNGTDGNPKVPFPLVLDQDLKAVDALGIRGDLATPSTYILDKQGNVVFAYVGEPHTTYDRPSVEALLGQLDNLNAKK
jgi:peroxiredoxin